MKNKIAILLLFLVALTLYVLPIGLKKSFLVVSDEIVFFTTAENLTDKASFYIQDINYKYNEKYNTNIFGKKHFGYFPGKGMVGQYPFGFPVLLAIWGKIFGGHMEFMVPFFGAIGVIIFYLLNKMYFNNEQALYASLLLMVMPGYVYWSTFMYADIPSVVLFLLGLYLFEIFLRTKKSIWLIFGSFILGFNVCVKYTNIILVPVLLFYVYVNRNEFKNFKKGLFVGCVSYLIPILLLMLYHHSIYGNSFVTGYHAFSSKLQLMSGQPPGEIEENILPAMTRGLRPAIERVLNFPLQAVVFLPYILLSIIVTFSLFNTHRNLFHLITLTFMSIVLFHVFIGKTWGSQFNEITMHSSYLRYQLSGLVILIIPAGWFIYNFDSNKIIKLILMLILILASIFNNVSSVPNTNLKKYYMKGLYQDKRRAAFLLNNIPEKSVIFSNWKAKYLLPNIATVLTDNVSIEKLVHISSLLLKDNVNVYFIDDGENKSKAYFLLNKAVKKTIDKKMKLYQIISIDTDTQKI